MLQKYLKKTPYLADLKPGGKYVARDMWLAGGVSNAIKKHFMMVALFMVIVLLLLEKL